MLSLDDVDAIFTAAAASESENGSLLLGERMRRVEALNNLRVQLLDGAVEDEEAVAEKIGIACRDCKSSNSTYVARRRASWTSHAKKSGQHHGASRSVNPVSSAFSCAASLLAAFPTH